VASVVAIVEAKEVQLPVLLTMQPQPLLLIHLELLVIRSSRHFQRSQKENLLPIPRSCHKPNMLLLPCVLGSPELLINL